MPRSRAMLEQAIRRARRRVEEIAPETKQNTTRVAAIESEDLDARVAALEQWRDEQSQTIAALDARVAALEALLP